MSAEEKRQMDREMTRGLCMALDPVIEGRRDPRVVDAARDVAQLLVLPGLDRLLAALPRGGRGVEPAELHHALGRLRRERDRALAQSSLVAFYESDRELAALASHLENMEWTAAPQPPAAGTPSHAPREAVLELDQALGGAHFVNEAAWKAAGHVRLTAPVAAVLRAALDWLFGPGEERALLRVTEDAGTVEVECSGVDPAGLLPAHEVISAVGGCLGPSAGGGRGAWTLRVPAVAERESFLMIQQDELRLALPWANVLRIQLETAEDEPLPAPPLAPLTPLTGPRRGRPIVTVGLGLRRGALGVDRLVWRLAAEPADVGTSPPPGTKRPVRCDDGEIFWVVDVARLMRDVPMPSLPEPMAPPRGEPLRGAPPTATPATKTGTRAADRAPRPGAAAPPSPIMLALLQADQVESLPSNAPGPETAETPPAAPGPQPTPETTRAATPGRAPTPAQGAAPGPPAAPPRSAAPPHAPAPEPTRGASFGRGHASRTRPPDAPRATRTPPVSPADPRPSVAPPAPPSVVPGHGRRALIAEDSLMARVFLTRLLNAEGYDVHSAGTAQELRGALGGETWTLVCVDVDLPDARGEAWIREVADSQSDLPDPAIVVALVRDGSDMRAAESAGVHRCLLKPFSQPALVRLLERAGLPAAGPR